MLPASVKRAASRVFCKLWCLTPPSPLLLPTKWTWVFSTLPPLSQNIPLLSTAPSTPRHRPGTMFPPWGLRCNPNWSASLILSCPGPSCPSMSQKDHYFRNTDKALLLPTPCPLHCFPVLSEWELKHAHHYSSLSFPHLPSSATSLLWAPLSPACFSSSRGTDFLGHGTLAPAGPPLPGPPALACCMLPTLQFCCFFRGNIWIDLSPLICSCIFFSWYGYLSFMSGDLCYYATYTLVVIWYMSIIFLQGVSPTRGQGWELETGFGVVSHASTLSGVMTDVQYVYVCVDAFYTPKLTPGSYSLMSLHLFSSYLKSSEIRDFIMYWWQCKVRW